MHSPLLRHAHRLSSLLLIAAVPTMAQDSGAPTRSLPMAAPLPPARPSPRDEAWPGGTMRLDVDATDIERRIIRVRQTISLGAAGTAGGPLTLLLPQWLPGHHAPRGEVEKIAGLSFTADGSPVRWARDAIDIYALHVDLPAGTRVLVASFDYLGATEADEGRIKITDDMLNLQWENVSLYPAGHYTRRIPVQATVTWPEGWTAATALRGDAAGPKTSYQPVDYETLIDSPVFAGRYSRTWDLGQSVSLHVFATDNDELAARPDQIAAHRKLVNETVALFGARPFDRYDFLLAISDDLGGIGLEHARSSENAVPPGYFRRWDDGPASRNLLPHELVHSWNGKYRRPAGLWTPDFGTPMRGDLLWVYEGQTQFWGYVLAARAGIVTKEQTLDALATIAASLDRTGGRRWRPVIDTARDPVITARRPKSWPDWQRSEDYYNEGLMIWLEADAVIRRGTDGKRGLDDFARAFFAPADGDWGTVTYDRADVIVALNNVMPYDWDRFLAQRVDGIMPQVPQGGFDLGGYRLGWSEMPGPAIRGRETERRQIDQSHGVGMVVRDSGDITAVIWDSAAFRAGLTGGDRITAVAGREYRRERLLAALRASASGKAPLELVVKRGDRLSTIRLDYSGGLRYPRLEKTGEGEGNLDRLLLPRT